MNPYQKGNQAYKKAAVNTMDQGALILMLYDGALRFLRASLIKLEAKDLEGSHNNLLRAKDIVAELMASLSLDNSGEIGANLKDLYGYIYNRLIDANVNKDPELIRESILLISELRDGWKGMLDATKAPKNPVVNQRSAVKTVSLEG